ncbi:MAG TPA: hypothetical protein VH682_10040 [Gemmataceae bacterium]
MKRSFSVLGSARLDGIAAGFEEEEEKWVKEKFRSVGDETGFMPTRRMVAQELYFRQQVFPYRNSNSPLPQSLEESDNRG